MHDVFSIVYYSIFISVPPSIVALFEDIFYFKIQRVLNFSDRYIVILSNGDFKLIFHRYEIFTAK